MMRPKRFEPPVLPLVIVSHEHLPEVERRIAEIRNKEEWKRLEYDSMKLNEALMTEFGKLSTKADLVAGRRYGVIGYSFGANAVRSGQVLSNTGEMYLYVWTYYEDGVFRQQDAWDGIHERSVPGCPLIEL